MSGFFNHFLFFFKVISGVSFITEWQHWSQSASRRSARSQILLKEFLLTPTTQDQTPSDFDYAGLVVVAVFKISSKYVGITRSLATRRTLGIPKLLKCINKAQAEPERSRSRSHVIKNTAPELEPEPFLRKQRAPEPEPLHFCKSSAALLVMPASRGNCLIVYPPTKF